MKIDYLSCTKMLYVAEKLLRDYYTLPDIDADFAQRFDMAVNEIQEIFKQFEHGKLLAWEDMPTEIEDEYGNIKSEMSYDALTVNKKEVGELIKYLKSRCFLRQSPFIPREAIVSIVKQIESSISKDELVRVLEALPLNTIAWQISSGKYTLVDLLFRHAYTEGREKPIKERPLSFILAEFLNPIYYNIQNKKLAPQLFKYIDRILSIHASAEDYQEWVREAEKYTTINITTPPAQEHNIKKPIPIQIVSGEIKTEVEGLEKGLEAIAKSKNEDDRPKFPRKLPAGTKWQNIIIKFLDDENVYVQVKQFKYNTNYKEMGFVGKGNNPNPSEAWTFLKVLAKVNGELTIKDTEARDKYKKQKELLAKSLQSYFSLEYDPFYPYRSSSEKQGNSYKIKITLIPPLTDNKKPAAVEEDDDDLGVREYLKEQAPQVNEE